jgi:hypothetical protein
MSDDLFERAGAAMDCREVAEKKVTLKKAGAKWRGICPLNDCGKKSKSRPFCVMDSERRWKCFSCDPRGGDAVELEHRLFASGGETMADTARRMIGGVSIEESETSRARRQAARAAAEKAAMEDNRWKADLARRLWREAVSAAGTLVQTYLEARAIRGPVAARMLELLRFHPAAYHSGDPAHGVRLPAMIGLVTTELGATGGIHVTYLRPDGSGKTHRSPAKMMWGPQAHRLLARRDDAMGPPDRNDDKDLVEVVMPGGIWLSRPDAPGPLVVAEGIESSASRAIMLAGDLSLPVRAVAAGSLDRLQGFEATDKDGAVDVRQPTGDVLRPPFTWPENPGAPWGLIDAACDADMSPVTVLGRTGANRAGKSRTVPFVRDAAERARVCGRLATSAWKRRLAPGSETVVRASRPPAGVEFNNMVMAAEAELRMAGGIG